MDRGASTAGYTPPRSALSLPKIPRRTQMAWAWNIVVEWELGLGYDPARLYDGSSGIGP